MQSVHHRPLRDEVKELVLDELLAGRLPVGRSVGEVALARALGVSRTPLREALMALEHDRFVECQPGRGFVVCPLTADEVRDIYPIVWTLEQLAVRSGRYRERDLNELEALGRRIGRTRSARTRVRLDSEWHAALVARSDNERLASILDSVKCRITRYEIVYMRESDGPPTSVEEHAAIVAELRQGRKNRAATLVERHWKRGMEVVLKQMEPAADVDSDRTIEGKESR